MARARALLAVLTAAAGGALAGADWSGLRMLATTMVRTVPFLLVVIGVAAILRAAIPAGGRLGPLLLIAAGGVWLASEAGALAAWLRDAAAPVLLTGGVLLALTQPGTPKESPLQTHTRTVTAFLLPRTSSFAAEAPAQLTGRAILGHLTLDLSETSPPRVRPSQVDVHLSLIAGGIDLIVPVGWDVLVGSVGAARGVKFTGKVADGRFAGEEDPPDEVRWLVVHVLGFGGYVNVLYR